MGIFDRFPYSSTHEMNLDFMLGKATEIAESLQEIDTHKEQAEQAATNAAQSATNAAQAAQAAAGSQTAASASAAAADQHKTDAEDAADRAEAASDLADEAMEHAQTAATTAGTAAQNASTAADGAIASAAAAETRINNLAASLPEDFTELNNEVNDLKSAIDYGANNICPENDATLTAYGITFTPMGGGSYKVNGTATAHAHYNLYQNASGFLNGFQAGDSFMTYYNNPSNSEAKLWIAFIINGSEQWQNFKNGYNYLTIPSNATGMNIRLTVLNGNTINNAIVKPYVFDSKTKYEYDEEIDSISENVNTILSIVPYGYNPEEVETLNGLINIYGETVTPDGYAYAKVPVLEGEKYKVSGWYYVAGGNFPAYMLMNGDTRVSFYTPTVQGAFFNAEVTIPSGVTDLYINGYPGGGYPVAVSKYGITKIGATNYDSVLVGNGTEYAYTNINTAILNNADSIISVDFGTYETEVENLATDKKIIGKDVDLCILTGTNKDYDHPPIEIAGGIIKNFTVNMVNASSASHKGYCLHSDDSACANNTLIIESCKFNCEGQHSVGIGVYPGEELIFRNCIFENLGSDTTVPIYIHNSGASDGIATVRFYNCYFNGQKYAMQLQCWGSNANVNFEFIGCTCTTVTYGNTDDCVWTDYVSGSTHDTSKMHEFSGKFALLQTSHGNNVPVLNA